MTPIVLAIEIDPITGEMPQKAPSVSFYVRPESWENVPQTVERLTRQFEAGSPGWAPDRKAIADDVRARGKSLIFKAFVA